MLAVIELPQILPKTVESTTKQSLVSPRLDNVKWEEALEKW